MYVLSHICKIVLPSTCISRTRGNFGEPRSHDTEALYSWAHAKKQGTNSSNLGTTSCASLPHRRPLDLFSARASGVTDLEGSECRRSMASKTRTPKLKLPFLFLCVYRWTSTPLGRPSAHAWPRYTVCLYMSILGLATSQWLCSGSLPEPS